MDNDDAMKNERCLIKRIVEFNGKLIKVCMIFIGLTFLMGFYDERNIYVDLEEITVELGDALPSDKINDINSYLINSDFFLEDNVPKDTDGHTTMVGTYNYYIVYRNEERMYSRLTNKKSTISVIDTIKPLIQLKKSSLKFNYGSKININDIAICYDLSKCTITFKEKINTKKSGKHEVTIIATDESNNISEETIIITIKEKPVYYSKTYSSIDNHNNLINSRLSNEQKITLRNELVAYSKQFVGNPYVYGGTSLTDGTDCSGFTMTLFAKYGYKLPRVAVRQGYVGKSVRRSELLPGDLIVYTYPNGGGHVGMYIGNNKMIHAANPTDDIMIGVIFEGNKVYRRIIY